MQREYVINILLVVNTLMLMYCTYKCSTENFAVKKQKERSFKSGNI